MRIRETPRRRLPPRRPINPTHASLFFLVVIYFIGLCLFVYSFIWLPQFHTIIWRYRKQIRDPDVIAPKIFRSDPHQVPDSDLIAAEIFRSAEGFERKYEEMERKLKVYVYSEDDEYPDLYFYPPRVVFGRYSSESFFFKNIRESRLRTFDIDEANLFLIPISCHKMVEKVSSSTCNLCA
ncbi:uncharacterized protein LOC119981946 [Tripterygium wilfordii]|uniref:uncharacterized protein LOC119981946 n=1 Tax=Tripterygium wilfordii TaxID=458696 RepID=UPI0018F85605|nr:uncharacterized protein LOC119981946 [Tripterygium wilfordii]